MYVTDRGKYAAYCSRSDFVRSFLRLLVHEWFLVCVNEGGQILRFYHAYYFLGFMVIL